MLSLWDTGPEITRMFDRVATRSLTTKKWALHREDPRIVQAGENFKRRGSWLVVYTIANGEVLVQRCDPND